MIDAQNTTTTLYSYQKGIGANTEAILNRTLRHILYGDLYDDGPNGVGNGVGNGSGGSGSGSGGGNGGGSGGGNGGGNGGGSGGGSGGSGSPPPEIKGYQFSGGALADEIVTSLPDACAMYDQYWQNNGGAWWGSSTAQQVPPACVSASGQVLQIFTVIYKDKI